jgi:hypothetical protein
MLSTMEEPMDKTVLFGIMPVTKRAYRKTSQHKIVEGVKPSKQSMGTCRRVEESRGSFALAGFVTIRDQAAVGVAKERRNV